MINRYKFGLIVELASGAFHNLALTDADEVCARINAATARGAAARDVIAARSC